MALIACKDCKKEFSTDTKRCIHCGAYSPTKKAEDSIKAFLTIAFLAWLAFSYRGQINNLFSATVAAQNNAPSCDPSQIEVRNTKLSDYPGTDFIYVEGEIFNRCSVETAVQVRLDILDSNNITVYSHDTWPHSITNIGSNNSYQFIERIYKSELNKPIAQASDELKASVIAIKTERF